MKRKRWAITALCLTLVVAMIAALATSCTFIKENEERVANGVVASVKTESGLNVQVTRNEVLDYYNSYAYYLINYNGMSAEEAMDWAIENKIKSKYLVLKGIEYLKGVSSRQGKMYGEKYETAESVLTIAERYAAIYSVNTSMQTTLDGFVESAKQTALTSALSQAKRTDVKEIRFTEATEAYLKKEYRVGEEIDKARIQIEVVYDDDTVSDEAYTLPDSYYTTAFDSSSAGDKTMTVKFDERIEEDGAVTYETHTLDHAYTVVDVRATKAKPDEESDVDDISFGDVKVNRYASEAEIRTALGEEEFAKLALMDVPKKYEELRNDVNADPDLTDAYRQLNENITKANRSMSYYYQNAYESAVTSALQAEIYKTATEVSDADVVEQFRYLYATGKNAYLGVEQEDYADTFAGVIKSDRESLYYYPEIEDIDQFFYVYQILFNFSDAQKNFVTDNAGDNEDLQKQFYEGLKSEITTKESNPNYDADYDCPLHEKREEGATCKWEEENPESDLLCPSLAYVIDEEGNAKEVKFVDVFAALEAELKAVYDKFTNGEINEAERSEQAFAIFEDYMYRFNDDSGIMNSSSGYLIAPEEMDDPNGFYQQFLDLAYEVKKGGYFVGNAFNEEGKLAYNFTPYGVHLICISALPFAGATGELNFDFSDTAAVVAYLKQSYNLKGDTLYKKIKDALVSERRSATYSVFTTESVPDELLDDATKVTVHKKVKDKIYDDYIS